MNPYVLLIVEVSKQTSMMGIRLPRGAPPKSNERDVFFAAVHSHGIVFPSTAWYAAMTSRSTLHHCLWSRA